MTERTESLIVHADHFRPFAAAGEVRVGPKMKRVFEMVSRLPEDDQEVYATRWLHYLEWGVKGPYCCCEGGETLESFLGPVLDQPEPTPEEMAEMREMARTDPGMAAALQLYDTGGLDLDWILAQRNAR